MTFPLCSSQTLPEGLSMLEGVLCLRPSLFSFRPNLGGGGGQRECGRREGRGERVEGGKGEKEDTRQGRGDRGEGKEGRREKRREGIVRRYSSTVT